jgi:hypothetical protein
MCVIAYKPLGENVFTKETLAKCWEANDDGAGYAWFNTETNLWEVRKGFMTFKKFWRSFRDQHFTPENTIIAHFRIGTAGLKDAGNTHPFPVVDDLNEMRETNFACESILFHNGVVGKGEGDFSDTQVFVRDYVAPMIHMLGTDERIYKIYSKIFDGASRFILCKGPQLWKFGYAWVEVDKCFFSNGTWQYKTFTSYNRTWNADTGWSSYTSGVNQKNPNWADHKGGYANEYGRMVKGTWVRWDDSKTDLNLAADNKDGTIDFTKAKRAKGTREAKETKEDHTRTKTLFCLAGADGELKFGQKTDIYLRQKAPAYLICPTCFEDKRLNSIPAYAEEYADTLCEHCGSLFEDFTGKVIAVDLESYRKVHGKSLESIVSKPANFAKLTPAEKQAIIDSESEEMLRAGYL